MWRVVDTPFVEEIIYWMSHDPSSGHGLLLGGLKPWGRSTSIIQRSCLSLAAKGIFSRSTQDFKDRGLVSLRAAHGNASFEWSDFWLKWLYSPVYEMKCFTCFASSYVACSEIALSVIKRWLKQTFFVSGHRTPGCQSGTVTLLCLLSTPAQRK